MGVIARLKQMGGTGRPVPSLTAAASLTIQPDTAEASLSGTTQINAIDTGRDITPGRKLTFYRGAADIPLFLNTPGTTAAGLVDFGQTDTTFQLLDSVTLTQTNTGSWRRTDSPTN